MTQHLLAIVGLAVLCVAWFFLERALGGGRRGCGGCGDCDGTSRCKDGREA